MGLVTFCKCNSNFVCRYLRCLKRRWSQHLTFEIDAEQVSGRPCSL